MIPDPELQFTDADLRLLGRAAAVVITLLVFAVAIGAAAFIAAGGAA